MTDLRILLATPSAGYEQRVRQAFERRSTATSGAGTRSSEPSPPRRCCGSSTARSPDVVAIGPDLDARHAPSARAASSNVDRPEISVLLVSRADPDAVASTHFGPGVTRRARARRRGRATCAQAFDRALAVAAGRRHNLAPPAADPRGRIITVLSPKGGSGKTTLSTNLAVGLAMAAARTRSRIVDLDLQFGDVSSALRLTPEATLAGRGPRAGDRSTP